MIEQETTLELPNQSFVVAVIFRSFLYYKTFAAAVMKAQKKASCRMVQVQMIGAIPGVINQRGLWQQWQAQFTRLAF